jgi:hypothetical protein
MGTAADGAFAQNNSLLVDPAILAIDESTTPVIPGPSSAEGTAENAVEGTAENAAEGTAENAAEGTAENAVEDTRMENSLGIEDMATELSSQLISQDPFESRLLTNKTPLKRVRASIASEKKINKRIVPGAIGEMIDILKQERTLKGQLNGPTERIRALRTLELEYPNLAENDFNAAIELLQVDANVEIFNGLTVSKRRDAWLRSKLSSVS